MPVRLPVFCPSAQLRPGARLLGYLGEDGLFAYVEGAPAVSQAFVEVLARHPETEHAVRITDVCRQSACEQWGSGGCSVAPRAFARHGGGLAAGAASEGCGIRPSCRWRLQEGDAACGVCPEVRTVE